MGVNKMLGWIYREIDLSSITASLWRVNVRPSESFDWLLERIQIEYDSDNNDPSQFDNIRWRLEIAQRNSSLQDITQYKPRSPVSMSAMPGINDLTAGTTRPKELFYNSPLLNWPIQSLEVFSFELTGFSALTSLVRVLFIGAFVLPTDPIKAAA